RCSFRPDCFKIRFQVPGARSAEGLPAMVTRPALGRPGFMHKTRYFCTVPEARMRSYPLHEARSKFSTLIDRALGGEPQRVTRHGKEAVIIVSEASWNARPRSA